MLDEAQTDKGRPDIADGVILIDFDGTIAPFGHMFNFPEPLPGAIEALKAFQDAGMRVVIFTSRLSPIWLETVKQSPIDHVNYINEYLGRYGIEPYAITAQKVPSIAYIDDNAYRYDGNWDELVERILI
jgi:hydroxymethylpyrimidine pyrophosphatase-like HAD family hydrolase